MKRFLAFLYFVLTAFVPQVVLSGELTPIDVSEFYITPNESTKLHWYSAETPTSDQLNYTIDNGTGQSIVEGVATFDEKIVSISTNLPQGYWEIAFNKTGERFGVVAIPAATEPFDKFFAMDGALSWLVKDDSLREGMIKSMKRLGIGMVRERFRLETVCPKEGEFNWETEAKYDTIRQTFKRHGIEVLELSHYSPSWTGMIKVYPRNLRQYADLWKVIPKQWQETWGGIEVWNEPDIFFGGDLPADQYVAVAKGVAYRFQQDGCKTPIIGGTMALYNQDWLDSAAKNGLLDFVDLFSFHTYEHAHTTEELIGKYRHWLCENGYANMPLWITECGRPWKIGPERPPVDQDFMSATDIVMKGVESKCCGIDRYFAFVLPYFEETVHNFGMLGKDGTPLRSMAGYAQFVRALSHRKYVGDLRPKAFSVIGDDTSKVQRARVFRESKGPDLIVFYTGHSEPVELKTTLTIDKVESVTGETLSIDSLKITNGLIYLYANVSDEMLKTDTTAMRLLMMTKKPFVHSGQKISPYVSVYDYADESATSAAYKVPWNCDEDAILSLKIHNLSDDPLREIAVSIRVKPDLVEKIQTKVSPDTATSLRCENRIRFTKEIEATEELEVECTVSPKDSPEQTSTTIPSTTILRFFIEPTLNGLLKLYPKHESLDYTAEKLTPFHPENATLNIEQTQDGVLLHCKFGEGDKWCYPQFQIPEGVSLEKYSGLILRGRATGKTTSRQFLFERENGAGYITDGSLFPADGQWHVVRLPFDRLSYTPSTPSDSNSKLDLENVGAVALGFNATSEDATLEISDLYLY